MSYFTSYAPHPHTALRLAALPVLLYGLALLRRTNNNSLGDKNTSGEGEEALLCSASTRDKLRRARRRRRARLAGGKAGEVYGNIEEGYLLLRGAMDNWELALGGIKSLLEGREEGEEGIVWGFREEDVLRGLLREGYGVLERYNTQFERLQWEEALWVCGNEEEEEWMDDDDDDDDDDDSFVSATTDIACDDLGDYEEENVSGGLQRRRSNSGSTASGKRRKRIKSSSRKRTSSTTAELDFIPKSVDEFDVFYEISIGRLEDYPLDEGVPRNGDPHVRYTFYKMGVHHVASNKVPVRKLRTKAVGCDSDEEFMAKLFCVREALDFLFADAGTRKFFKTSGKGLVADLLQSCGTDPSGFKEAYDDMISFCEQDGADVEVVEELKHRGVRAFSFFDLVLDFVILDAFDDLENPPQAILSVIQNRWLPASVKTKALSAAVWSVLKAKAGMLPTGEGTRSDFMRRFYGITEHVSPVLVCGFLGPDENMRKMCTVFKEHMQEFMLDIFSFDNDKYHSKERLASCILASAKDKAFVALTLFRTPSTSS
eukprot:Nk52_evm1s1106 gene=Nk52_evmTU1s1106